MGSNRQPGDSDSDSDDNDVQPVQVSRRRQKANRYGPHAEKLCAEAKVLAEEVEAAVASLRGAIVAFEEAEDEGFDKEGVVDEGFGVRALKEAFSEFGISAQRYWNGTVNLNLP